ncbi:Oligoendopeptidase F [Planctomycetales bacterium 10988]|nr:Oligoendopeptidase F [Planctomycetales bacterium 10988]
MSTVTRLPKRSEVPTEDTWDLSSLFPNDEAWEEEFQEWQKSIAKYEEYQGTMEQGAHQLASFLDFDNKFDRQAERLQTYAFLKTAEDVSEGKYQTMMGRIQNAGSRAAQAASFFRPELLAIPEEKMQEMLKSEELEPYQLLLDRILRYKPHTLSGSEERLLAMQSEMASTASQTFRQLNNADLDFGEIELESGKSIELSHASFSRCLHHANRELRQKAFDQYYQEYEAHKNTIAATLSGSIQGDIYYARAKNYPSALEASLFTDNVPVTVYDNLIEAVHQHLPALYRYYEVRRRKMNLETIHHYDTYVPILSDLSTHYSWDEAVEVVTKSLEPLGSEYCGALEKGLQGRWCDRYENKGKQSGAFSCGSFDGDPYILMNYQDDVLDHVFTLTHEAGHSMHSYYSAAHQPFQYYNYTIFVAEVASTFNEQLLGRYLMDAAGDDQMRAYLINKEIDSLRGTLIRQAMFAEFEKITHAIAEANEPLTLGRFRDEYQTLLELYFGPDFTIDPQLSLECLRIPHFYRAFYVYKYATGISAAVALAERVISGGDQELTDYLSFLKGGCSKFPLDLLRDAGVDLEEPTPVNTALERFESLVDELDSLI